jgi:hypothetical protein
MDTQEHRYTFKYTTLHSDFTLVSRIRKLGHSQATSENSLVEDKTVPYATWGLIVNVP